MTKDFMARKLVDYLMITGFLKPSMDVDEYEERVASWVKHRTKKQLEDNLKAKGLL